MAGSGLLGIIGDIYRSGKQKDQEARIGELSKGIAMMPKSQRTPENIQRYLAGRNATDFEVQRIQDTLQKWADYRKTMAPPKPEYEQQTIYGPQGETKRIAIQKGQSYTPETGWSFNKPEKPESAYKLGQTYEVKRDDKIETHRVIGKMPDGTPKTQVIAIASRFDKKDKEKKLDPEKKLIVDVLSREYRNLQNIIADDTLSEEDRAKTFDRMDKIKLIMQENGVPLEPKKKSLGQITKEQALEELRRRGEIQ